MRVLSVITLCLLWSVSFSQEQAVVGKTEMVMDGDNPLVLRRFNPWNQGGSWVTDISYATLRERDGSVTIMSNGHMRYLRWTGSRLADDDMQGQGLGTLRQHKLLKTSMMPRNGFLGFLGPNKNKELQNLDTTTWIPHWLSNVYKISNHELLGFIHQEDYSRCKVFGERCNSSEIYRISMAYPRDNGVSWNWLGHIIRSFHDRNYVSNLNGVPIVVTKDGFIHAYFNDARCSIYKEDSQGQLVRDSLLDSSVTASTTCPPHSSSPDQANQYPAVARAKLSDVITAARKGAVVPWFKYNNGKWDKQAMSELGSNIITEYPSFAPGRSLTLYSEGDAAFSPILNKYLMLVPIWLPRKDDIIGTDDLSKQGIYLYYSDDGVLWSNPQQVVSGKDTEFFRYASFIGKNDGVSSDDFNVIGNSFYILYAGMCRPPNGEGTGEFWKFYDVSSNQDGSRYVNNDGDKSVPMTPANIYRTEITVAKPNVLTSATGAANYLLENATVFQLTDFPQSWKPKSIVFQISAIDGTPLEGSVNIGNFSQSLSDWTKEFRLKFNNQASIDVVVNMPSQRRVMVNYWADGAEGTISVGSSSSTEPNSSSSGSTMSLVLNEMARKVDDGVYTVTKTGTCYNGIIGMACNNGQCKIELDNGTSIEPGWWSTVGLASASFNMTVSGGGLARFYCW